MPQTTSLHNSPHIAVAADGKGWWRYQVTLHGSLLFDGWTRGKRADAQRDAEHRFQAWQSRAAPAPVTDPDADDWLDTPEGRRWMEEQLDRLNPPLLSKEDDPDYLMNL